MSSERRIVSAARTPLTPDEVARRSFSSVFRGIDPTEVRDFLNRVADDLNASLQREAMLKQQLDEANEQLAQPPKITEDMVTEFLGQETASILQSAHQAAHEIRSKAEETAERMRTEALTESTAMRSSAENLLDERTEAAEAAASEIRRAAEAAAEALRSAAQQEADSIRGSVQADVDEMLNTSRETARAMVQEAQAIRAKVLNDFARRRKLAHAQVEQLLAGRERLLDAYRVVRENLDGVFEELEVAESQAREAAENVGRRIAEEPDITAEELEAELASINPPVEESDQPNSGAQEEGASEQTVASETATENTETPNEVLSSRYD